MSRESDAELHFTLVRRATRCFLIGMLALTFGQVAIAFLVPLIGLRGVHKDWAVLAVKLSVVLFIGVRIYPLDDRILRLAYAMMSSLLLILQLVYLAGDTTKTTAFFLRAADPVVITLLVLFVYRLATEYASAKEAVEDEFLAELAEGTSTRLGTDFLWGLASSTNRTLKTCYVCVTVAQGTGRMEQVAATAARTGSVPSALTPGKAIEFPCHEIHGQRVHTIPLTDSAGKMLGHICLLHDGGLTLTKKQKSTLRVFGARAAAELERQRLDETKTALELKMMQVQKLQSLGVMAGGIAHDFNNLLTAVRSNATVLRDSCFDNNDESLVGIEAAVDRGAALCNQLLAYAGCTVRQNSACDINRMIRQLNTVVRATHPDRVFELRLCESEICVWGDEAQLSQVLLNLMTNALESTERIPLGLFVKTSHIEASQIPGVDQPCVRIEISDLGNGITKKDLKRIFDPFYTTKETGRGLGLAAVLGIVHQHSGDICVDSQPSIGTTFTVTLPLHPGHESTDDSQVESTSVSICDDKCRVLLVDDDVLVRKSTRSVLERYGMSVVTAESGVEAIEIFQREGDVFHAIILDQTMPGMTGIETFIGLRDAGATGRGLLVSGYSDLSDFPDEMAFLPKPFAPSKLIAAITSQELDEAPARSKAEARGA